MQELWTRWEPENILPRKYNIELVTETNNGELKITLSDPDDTQKVYVTFPEIDSYRNTNESYTLEIIHYLEKTYGRSFYANWTFFKIENSEYLEWLSDKSHGISDDYQMMHFCILGRDFLVDIACTSDPIILVENTFTDIEVDQQSIAKDSYEPNSETPDITDSTLGKKGVLEDGRLISVRKYSHDGNAMMEIFNPQDKHRIKIRYKK